MAKGAWDNPRRIKIVQQEIRKSPDNLSKAFAAIAKRTGSTEGAVCQAWYNKLKSQMSSFNVTSRTVSLVNKKNSPRRVRTNQPIHQVVISNKTFDGMKVVTVKQYFPA